MKTEIKAILTALAVWLGAQTSVHAQSTTFTYQGRLNFNGSPAAGSFDLTFTVFATNVTGSALAGTVANTATPVTNGLFTVPIDFGAGVFTGPARWLEIAARTNGSGAFATLAPRQALTAAPYAVFANAASNLLGNVAAAQVSGVIAPAQLPANVVTNIETGVTLGGTFAGNGGGLTNLDASALASGTVPPNVLAGFQAPYYAVINGGQNNTANNTYAVVGGGADNSASYLATVSGGQNNNASGYYAAIPGGQYNVASGQFSFAAGQQAQALHQGAFVWADSQPGPFASLTNDTFNIRAFGGVNFQTRGAPMTLNGFNVLTGSGSNFWQTAGNAGTSPANGNFLGTTDNQPLELRVNDLRSLRIEPGIYAGTVNIIGGSPGNFVAPGHGADFIGGGGQSGVYTNSISDDGGFIGGGEDNVIGYGGTTAAIVGGAYNLAASYHSFIGAGDYNSIQPLAAGAFIGGGSFNTIQTNASGSTVVGGYANTNWSVNAVIAGGVGNVIGSGGTGSSIGAGYYNLIQSNALNSIIDGGVANTVAYDADSSIIAGGASNYVDIASSSSVIGGGSQNWIQADGTNNTIGGGQLNIIIYGVVDSTIAGGEGNYAQNDYTTISGGYGNFATGSGGTVPGGFNNSAAGSGSFAAGTAAKARNIGSFVWADDSQDGVGISDTGNNQFIIRAAGGVGINTNAPVAGGLTVNGKINSPLWKVSQPINVGGAMPWTGTFTSSGGTLTIFASGSGYSTTANTLIGMDVKLDGVIVDSCFMYANSAATHLAFVPKTMIKTGVAAGTHTLTFSARSGTTSDNSDNFCGTVTELPF